MNIKIASASLLGMVTMALASLSCSAEEPASTATPIPQASAQEVVESACDHMEGVDSYDFMASVKAEQDGVPFPDALTVEASVSGKDYQISFTGGDGSTSEGIWVGNKGYTRSTAGGNVWEVSAAPLENIVSQLSQLGDSPVCPDLSNVSLKGEDELDGVKVTVYTSGDTAGVEKDALDDVDSSFQGLKHASIHEYWVDGNGLLVQHREDRYTLSQYNGGRTILRYVTLATFLDVGEPNVITAPTIP